MRGGPCSLLGLYLYPLVFLVPERIKGCTHGSWCTKTSDGGGTGGDMPTNQQKAPLDNPLLFFWGKLPAKVTLG